MKKRILVIFVFAVLFFSIIGGYFYLVPSDFIKRPFKSLDMNDIESAEIAEGYLWKRDVKISLTQEETEELLGILKKINIKRICDIKDEDFKPVEGGYSYPEMFCLKLKSGKTIRIGAEETSVRFYYIDFIKYEIKKNNEKVFVELEKYYQKLLWEKNIRKVLI